MVLCKISNSELSENRTFPESLQHLVAFAAQWFQIWFMKDFLRARDSLCKYNLLFCRMQDFFHRRRLPRFGFPLTSRHASVDAASAGAATQSTPSGGALTNSRLPSSSTSKYPPTRQRHRKKPLRKSPLPQSGSLQSSQCIGAQAAARILPCPIAPLSVSADMTAVNASRKPSSAALPITCAGTLRAAFFFPICSSPFLLQRMYRPSDLFRHRFFL